jgi:hypothetical protein
MQDIADFVKSYLFLNKSILFDCYPCKKEIVQQFILSPFSYYQQQLP